MAGARQPIELLQAKGKKHLTKKEISDREKTEIKAAADKITPPDYLSEEQKNRFEFLAAELKRVKIMTNLDVDILARFVVASELYEYFTGLLFDEKTREDIWLLDKISRLQDKYYGQCLTASKELGLTISSRCKLAVPDDGKKENPLLKVLGSDD